MNLACVPDDFTARLGSNGSDPERQALEGSSWRFRAGRLSEGGLGQFLGLECGDQIDRFLKAREVFEPCTIGNVDQDVVTLAQLGV